MTTKKKENELNDASESEKQKQVDSKKKPSEAADAEPTEPTTTIFTRSTKKKVAVDAEDNEEHRFWKTQPVPQKSQQLAEIKSGPLESKELDKVRSEPYKLPAGFEWCLLNWDDDAIVEECYVLLRDNYVEDDDAMFRFDYSREFLKWSLMVPDWERDWQVGVKQTSNSKIRAMITGTRAHINADGQVMPMAEINFLCVFKGLREHRLAPVLIKEVTRRVNLKNIWQAVYTAGVRIPTPIGVAKYWHRSLNIRKLIDIGFTSLHPRQTIQRLNRLMQLPEEVTTPGWRPFELKDVKQVTALLRSYLSQFKLHVEFHEHEVAHMFLPKEEVVSAYVVEGKKGKVTDFASFYHLYSSVIRNPKHKTLRAAYSYYNAPGTLTIKDLLTNLLIEANKQKCDVFNCLDLMQNRPALEPLKFGIGDGDLHYYLYNYALGAECEAKDIGVVLV